MGRENETGKWLPLLCQEPWEGESSTKLPLKTILVSPDHDESEALLCHGVVRDCRDVACRWGRGAKRRLAGCARSGSDEFQQLRLVSLMGEGAGLLLRDA